jgi:hypothetical protein
METEIHHVLLVPGLLILEGSVGPISINYNYGTKPLCHATVEIFRGRYWAKTFTAEELQAVANALSFIASACNEDPPPF